MGTKPETAHRKEKPVGANQDCPQFYKRLHSDNKRGGPFHPLVLQMEKVVWALPPTDVTGGESSNGVFESSFQDSDCRTDKFL